MIPQQIKSSPETIRNNFDQQVDRFSNLETGQTTAIDSPLCMELVARSAIAFNPDAKRVMDVGCGGGNYAVKVTSLLPDVDCTLVDISANMLERAVERVGEIVSGKVTALHGDYRELDLGENQYDVITAGTTLHHLRSDEEWELVFRKIYRALKPGGTFWINDIVIGETEEITQMMLDGWKSILRAQVGEDKVGFYLEKYESEDTPRTLSYQLDLMKSTGFKETFVLHKHFNFAAFGARKLK
jgi:tRNA (cmo5U34)-methyltransferase